MIEKIIFWLLIKLLRIYGEKYLDQWTKIKFKSSFGPVYVSIMRSDPYPDSFDDLDKE